MAYDKNALNLVTEGPLAGGGQQWKYNPVVGAADPQPPYTVVNASSIDNKSTTVANNFFSDAQARGVKAGDQIVATSSDVVLFSMNVTSVSSSGAIVTAGTAVLG